MTIKIPEQFKKYPDMRFLMIEPDTKKPLGLKWQSIDGANYSAAEIESKNINIYGVCAGSAGILCFDIDKHSAAAFDILSKTVDLLPETYTIQSPSGGLHLYYKLSDPEKGSFLALKINGDGAGEIRYLGDNKDYKNVIGPGSIKGGLEYKTIKDIPIAEIKWENIYSVVSQYSNSDKEYVKLNSDNPTVTINIMDVAKSIPLKRNGKEYVGANPIHGATHGNNFNISVDKNAWFCHRCNCGGGPVQLSYLLASNTCEAASGLKGIDYINQVKHLEIDLKKILLVDQPTSEKFIVAKVYRNMDFSKLARDAIKKLGIFYDPDKGLFWSWDDKDKMWAKLNKDHIMHEIDMLVENNSGMSKSDVQTEIVNALKLEGMRNKPKAIDWKWIQFKGKLVNFVTLEIMDASKEWFCINPLPWEYNPKEECPTIDKYLNDWAGENKEVLYEVSAFACLRKYLLHRIIWLCGSGGNGKGRYLALLERLIGQSNMASSELELIIGSRFETFKIHNKLVCQIGETDYSILSKTDRIKKMSGEDLVPYEQKNGVAFDDHNYAKIIISTNGVPICTDTSDGFHRRQLIIDFPNSFAESGDIIGNLSALEMSAFASKLILYMQRIYTNNKFTGEGTIAEKRKIYDTHANPFPKFVLEKYDRDPNGSIPLYEVFDEYNFWLKQNGKRMLGKPEFKKILEHDNLEVVYQKIHKPDGGETMWNMIYGICKRKPIADTAQTVLTNQKNMELI